MTRSVAEPTVGMRVSVTDDSRFLEMECEASGIGAPQIGSTIAHIVKVDMADRTVLLDDELETWVPIRALKGFAHWRTQGSTDSKQMGLKVGGEVRLAEDAHRFSDASDGPLNYGEVGVISGTRESRVHPGLMVFEVLGFWYQPGALVGVRPKIEFRGHWSGNENGSAYVIGGRAFTWTEGTIWKYNERQCLRKCGDEVIQGNLHNDRSLRWSSGEVWWPSQGNLGGEWLYGDDQRYQLTAVGNEYRFEEEHPDGTVCSGMLAQKGGWYQGRLAKASKHFGFLRVHLHNGRVISNFRGRTQDEWGNSTAAFSVHFPTQDEHIEHTHPELPHRFGGSFELPPVPRASRLHQRDADNDVFTAYLRALGRLDSDDDDLSRLLRSHFVLGNDDEQKAKELGLDVATYRQLKELERRDISPEDYELLGKLDEGKAPPTLNYEQLQMFSAEAYDPSLGADSCPLCKADFEGGDQLRHLQCCQHASFHCRCIDPWLLEHSIACPLCKTNLV